MLQALSLQDEQSVHPLQGSIPAWHTPLLAQEQTWGLPEQSVFWCSPQCQLDLLARTGSPSGLPAQLSCFQPFISISSLSLAKGELLMQNTTGIGGPASLSPHGAFHQQIPMALTSLQTRKWRKIKGTWLVQVQVLHSLHTACLPSRHV